VREGIITIDNRKYPMRKHGLVRDRTFRLVDRSSDSLTFLVTEDESSRTHFPYDFSLVVKYTISDTRLDIKYTITTQGEEPMPFNIGAHPAFNVPIDTQHKRSDYYLIFSEMEKQMAPIINSEGLISDVSQSVLSHSKKLHITDHLFDQDALILHHLNSDQLSLVGPNGIKHWTFSFEGFTHLGIWSKNQDAPFVCIEPWYGMADLAAGPEEFRQKPAIQSVASNEEWSCTHSITIYD